MRLTLLTVIAFSGLAVVHGESEASALRGFSKKKRWEQCGVLGERKEVPLKTRIVHGEDADQCVWRWQVSLSTPSNQFCGGTLIAPGWVLTAAHCVAHVRSACAVRALRVHAGSWKRIPGSNGAVVERTVKKIFLHPLYNQNVPHDYDFAIVQLDKAMPLNECIGVACLPSGWEEKPGTNCSITGWGTLKSMGPTPDVLQEATVSLLNESECERNYSHTKQVITASMLCASGSNAKGIVDTCQGDSGGPLSCLEGDRWTLRGVTSWGQGCAYANFPGVYGKVQSVMSWIKDVTAEKVRRSSADRKKETMNITGINFNGSMWAVIQGNCTQDADHCIMSPNYPKNYSTRSICTIAVNDSAAVPIHVVNFSTELRFDALISDCRYFSGSKGPENVVPKGPIFWHSDDAIVSSGWKLCPKRS